MPLSCSSAQTPSSIPVSYTHLDVYKRQAALRAELAALRRTRGEQRRARMRSELPRVAIMGYTNAGKSTLLNLSLIHI